MRKQARKRYTEESKCEAVKLVTEWGTATCEVAAGLGSHPER